MAFNNLVLAKYTRAISLSLSYRLNKHYLSIVAFSCLFSGSVTCTFAEPNQLGQTGLINMPDARIEPEGTLRFGLSYMKPYSALWGSVSAFDWLELSARYTEIDNVDAFTNRPDDNYGDYKDKAFDFKLRLVEESSWIPQITFGLQDYLGTKVFEASFITLKSEAKRS